ncbi:uncharacterized protein LTR77_009796 [Saxophila tyrrhenica]|uniref:Uncharacterized protein n=1 Tax=Saxophila tyrrhenica TaxID=1690608 RepID=A0AAV9NXU9_9PEZI|nr:hypothetical protein LTR77_009796 [Saxophila tyrrhenica]
MPPPPSPSRAPPPSPRMRVIREISPPPLSRTTTLRERSSSPPRMIRSPPSPPRTDAAGPSILPGQHPERLSLALLTEGLSPRYEPNSPSSVGAHRGSTEGTPEPNKPDAPERGSTPSNPGDIEKLIKWLDLEYNPSGDFLESKHFAMRDLQYILKATAQAIDRNFDAELYQRVQEAWGSKYCIEVFIDQFFADRPIEWEYASGDLVDTWDEMTLKEYLNAARKEIEWIHNKLNRLDLHMRNAEYLKSIGNRNSFSYIPTEREKGLSK